MPRWGGCFRISCSSGPCRQPDGFVPECKVFVAGLGRRFGRQFYWNPPNPNPETRGPKEGFELRDSKLLLRTILLSESGCCSCWSVPTGLLVHIRKHLKNEDP